MDDRKPEIIDTRLIAKSRLFGIEEMHLRFSNGEERTYERLRTPPIAGVMCVPLLDQDTVVLIREYGAGVEDYQITLPKGAYEHGEDWRSAGEGHGPGSSSDDEEKSYSSYSSYASESDSDSSVDNTPLYTTSKKR